MTLKNRKSLLALVKQTSHGNPVKPSAASDYVALQSGFDFAPQFEELETNELQDSIGMSKRIVSSEDPQMSMSHYLRHSGVEGQAPDFGILLESLMGSVTSNATEYDTVAASTTTELEVDTGEGSNFEVGQAVLVKDPTNGYSVRNVKSINGDTLELSFALDTAPGTGVNLGKAVHYKLENEGHPYLSIWGYRADGGAVELISDAIVTELTFDVQAAQLINGSFTLAGLRYLFNPIEIETGSTYLDIEMDDGTVTEYSVSLSVGFYKDPHALASEIEQKFNDLSLPDSLSVTYDDSNGKFVFQSDNSAFALLIDTGSNSASSAWSAIGFSGSDKTGANEYTSGAAIDLTSGHTPDYDDQNPLLAKGNEVLVGDQDNNNCFNARSVAFNISNTQTRVPDLCEETGYESREITGREITVDIVATLNKFDAKHFRRFRKGESIQFGYTAGVKDGGEWKAGTVLNAYMPTATVASHKLGAEDGIVTLEMTLRAFVEDGSRELHFNFL